jgi:hypothetical protein
VIGAHRGLRPTVATFDVADGIERAPRGAAPGIAVERCSAAVERSDTRKEQG